MTAISLVIRKATEGHSIVGAARGGQSEVTHSNVLELLSAVYHPPTYGFLIVSVLNDVGRSCYDFVPFVRPPFIMVYQCIIRGRKTVLKSTGR